jgi:hypothetical protein
VTNRSTDYRTPFTLNINHGSVNLYLHSESVHNPNNFIAACEGRLSAMHCTIKRVNPLSLQP